MLKKINLDYSLGGLMLKLKLQYFGHLMQRANSLEKTDGWERLRIGGEWGNRDKMIGWHHRLNGHSLSKFWEIVKDRDTWNVLEVTKSQTQLSD